MISRVGSRLFGRKGAAVAAAALIVFAPAATAAAAGPVASEVEVILIDSVGPDSLTVIYGIVIADKRVCESGRTVEAIAVTPTGDVPIDTGRTGAGGGWQARGTGEELAAATALKLRLQKKTVKRGKKTIKCDGETVQLT